MCIIANAMMKKILCKIVRDPVYSLLVGTTIAIVASLLWTMLFTAADGGVFAQWLDAEGKNETIKLIGLGLGGALAAMGTVALNRRAAAMMQQNTLIERGHIDERFKAAVQSLGSEQPSARIAAFYQFYHLAKNGSADEDFVKSIFDILCAHLRQITSRHDYRNGEGQEKPTEECQTLLDVIFRNPQHLFTEMTAHLRGVYLVGADLRHAQFGYCTDLEGARLDNTNLQHAQFVVAVAPKVSFRGADINGTVFAHTDMHHANLYAAKNIKKAIFSDAIFISPSDEEHYPAWFEEGRHYKIRE